MKWTFRTNKNNTKRKIISDLRITLSTNAKKEKTSIYFTKSALDKIGNTAESVCFGIGQEGVFVTSKNFGTLFAFSKHGSENCKSVYSKELVSEIMEYFKCTEKTLDVNLVQADKDIWQLIPKSKWGWK